MRSGRWRDDAAGEEPRSSARVTAVGPIGGALAGPGQRGQLGRAQCRALPQTDHVVMYPASSIAVLMRDYWARQFTRRVRWWWTVLTEEQRRAARQIARDGGFLPPELLRSLFREDVLYPSTRHFPSLTSGTVLALMPDDVRFFVLAQPVPIRSWAHRPPAARKEHVLVPASPSTRGATSRAVVYGDCALRRGSG